MRLSSPTNPLSAEIANLTIRLYDAVRRAGVSCRMNCSRTPRSGSKYLKLNDRDTIRISDHQVPGYKQTSFALDVVVRTIQDVADAERLALKWIGQNYGPAQV